MKLKQRYPRRQHTQVALSRKAIVSLAILACLMNSSLLVRSLRHPRPQPLERVMPAFLTGCGGGGNNIFASTSLHSRILSTRAANQNNRNNHYTTRDTATLFMSGGNNDESLGNDTSNKINKRPPTAPFTASPWENRNSLVGSLLEKTTSRAMRTLSTNAGGSDDVEDVMSTTSNNGASEVTVEDVIDATIVRSSSTMNEGSSEKIDGEDPNPTVESVLDASISRSSSILEVNNNEESARNSSNSNRKAQNKPKSATTANPKKQHQDKRTYLGNPSVTPTALAHSLWQSTILPYQDTIIDATCGNGKDCLALAKMLFPDSDDAGIGRDLDYATIKPQLIGIDIQARAVQNTKQSLLSSLPSDIYYDHVQVLEQSHEHLMQVVPREASSVGLVCYNLGYLPGARSQENPEIAAKSKETQTQTETTLNSITDASLLLRVGGLLSIMTYPGSNLEESIVVEHFVEGLAMLTTRDPNGWRGYVDNIPDYDNDDGKVREFVAQALKRVVGNGEKKQTWRAFVHKPLGRPLSPVLVTAMRIK